MFGNFFTAICFLHKTDLEISQTLSLQGQQFKTMMSKSQFMVSRGLFLTVDNEDR